MEIDPDASQEVSHLILGSNSVDNFHGKYPNRFSHFWNQTVHDLDRTDMGSRASRVVKSIKNQITSISVAQNNNTVNIKPSHRSKLSTSLSKYSIKSGTESQKQHFALSNKRISLQSKLEEIEKKIYEKPSLILRNKPEPLYDNSFVLFENKDVLSESTLSKIQEFHEKVRKMKESLNNSKSKSWVAPVEEFKKSRAIKKFRVTQYFSNNLKMKRRIKRVQNTIV